MDGCLNIEVNDLERDNHLTVQAGPAVMPITAVVSRIGEGLKAVGGMVGELIKVTASETSERLQIRCGVVCSVSDYFYLNVSPADVQWITDDVGVFFEVESNVEWRVLT